MLSDAQKQQFVRDGYTVLPGFRSPALIAKLRAAAEAIVSDFDPGSQRSVFSTDEQSHQSDDYFLNSGDKVRCFFEDEAFDTQGRLIVEKDRAINKIGHAMHDLDPAFMAFSHGADLASVARDVGLGQAHVYQSMYIFKQPHIGGVVNWHQDATYLIAQPMTVTAFWFALEDADQENGCLWVQPGGHYSPLREQFMVEGGVGRTEILDRTPWPNAAQAVPVEVKAGTLVVFHGMLPHYSAPNRSPRSRHAYTLHAINSASTWDDRNWLKRQIPLRGFE
jgi:phytanoyl-CoA hydroxylase